LSAAPLPTKEAVNRGLMVEGIGSLLAGAWGTGNGTTSYSTNIAAIGITKVTKLYYYPMKLLATINEWRL